MPSDGLQFRSTTWHLLEEIERMTFAWDLWLSGLCTGISVPNPGFDPGQKSILSHSL